MRANQKLVTDVLVNRPTLRNGGRVKLNQKPEKKPGKAKQENNVSKQLSSPGAEPPKDPNNNKPKLDRQKILQDFNNHKLGNLLNKIDKDQFNILLEAGIRDFENKHFKAGIDLSNQNLSNINFIGAGLIAANLSKSKLENCDFSDANLSKANLARTRLDACAFKNTDLANSDLNYSEILNVHFELTKLFNSDLTNAIINYCDFERSDLRESNWQEADFVTKIAFNDCNLSGEDFTRLKGCRRANIDHMILFASNLEHANFEGMKIPTSLFGETNRYRGVQYTTRDVSTNFLYCHNNLKNANLKNSKFLAKKGLYVAMEGSKPELKQLILSGANLEAADLSGLTLKHLACIATNLKDTNLEGAKLSNIDFRLCDLINASPKVNDQTKIDDASFLVCQDHDALGYIRRPSYVANFHHDRLSKLDLSNKDLSKVIFLGDLLATNFRGARFTTLDIDGSPNYYASFRNPNRTNFNFTDFRGSDISHLNFEEFAARYTDFGSLSDEGKSLLELIDRPSFGIDEEQCFKEYQFIDMSNRTFDHVDFGRSRLKGVNFENTTFNGVQFNNTFLKDANFTNATITNGDFEEANLSSTDFTGASITDSELTDSINDQNNLINAKNLEGSSCNIEDLSKTIGGHRDNEQSLKKTRDLFMRKGLIINKQRNN